MKNRFIIFVLFYVISSLSHAQWKNIGFDADNEFYYEYNVDTIAKVEYPNNANYKVWIKRTVTNDISQDGLGVGDYTMALQWINCSANTLGLKSVTAYKKTGQVIPNWGWSNSYVKMNDAIPETMGSAFVDVVCSNQ